MNPLPPISRMSRSWAVHCGFGGFNCLPLTPSFAVPACSRHSHRRGEAHRWAVGLSHSGCSGRAAGVGDVRAPRLFRPADHHILKSRATRPWSSARKTCAAAGLVQQGRSRTRPVPPDQSAAPRHHETPPRVPGGMWGRAGNHRKRWARFRWWRIGGRLTVICGSYATP